MKAFVASICIFCSFAQFASAAEITRQYMGVARATPEKAIMDLVSVCLTNPLIDAGLVAFAGIENLETQALPNDIMGKTYAGATCLYKSVSK